MTYQILMIEDDEQICEVVKDYFTRESENEIVPFYSKILFRILRWRLIT